MKTLTLVLAFVGVGALAFGQQAPPDTKGWHGAEWGMTKEQVETATGFKLGEAETGRHTVGSGPEEIAVECRPGGPTAIGSIHVTTVFCFEDSRPFGLVKVGLEAQDTTVFQDLRTELKARYGDPTAEEDQPGSFATWKQAKWLLPSTEIFLGWVRTTGHPDSLFLAYNRRTAPIL